MDLVLRSSESEYDGRTDYSIDFARPKEDHDATNASCKLPVQKAEKIHANKNLVEEDPPTSHSTPVLPVPR